TFGDGDVLMMEVNQQKHTLHFFVNGEQQPVFVQDIPASVRFFGHLLNKNEMFTVLSVKKVQDPQAKDIANQKAVNW
ncbi:MAG: hypothetical protein EZS28_056671, partial [Streblomastix strix]